MQPPNRVSRVAFWYPLKAGAEPAAGILGGASVGCRSLCRWGRDEGWEAETGNCPFKNKCKLSCAWY